MLPEAYPESFPVFLLPDLAPGALPEPDGEGHWMAHWPAEPGTRAVLNRQAGAFRLYATLQAVPGARVVVEGARIAGFAALCERHLDLGFSAVLLVVTRAGAPGLLQALRSRSEGLWFAPFAFPATLALESGLAGPDRAELLTAARDWGARVVLLDAATPGPEAGRPWAQGPRLLAESLEAAKAARRSGQSLRRHPS